MTCRRKPYGDKTGQDRDIKEAQEMLESSIKEGQW